MIIRLLLALCCVLIWTEEIRSENEYEVKKKGIFPFMAILYYPDETVVDASGNRFLHAAVLFKPEWLLSAAIDHSVLDNVPLGFPRKTLLARMGVLSFDTNFTLNEDDEEQEREVIRIVKPRNHNKESWWTTDITLLETLMPFKLSSAIAPTAINPKRTYVDNNCVILFYTKKFGSATDVKFLMQLGVEMMPPSVEHCGSYFSSPTMTCAKHDPADDMKSVYDLEFCPGNSGGPLLCEGEVMALQTYIENNCKQPHLYQLLAPWDTLINCALEHKCNADDDLCSICTSTHKDEPPIRTSPNNTQLDTAKETTGESYHESSKIPESYHFENNTSLEIPTRSTELSKRPLEPNYSTVSHLTESDEEQTKSSLSNKSEDFSSEQSLSSTSENSQFSTSMLSNVSVGTLQKMEYPGLEDQTVLSTFNITVSTLSTLSWLETTLNASQRRFMDYLNKDTTFIVKENLPKLPKHTTPMRKWTKKRLVTKEKLARFRVHDKPKRGKAATKVKTTKVYEIPRPSIDPFDTGRETSTKKLRKYGRRYHTPGRDRPVPPVQALRSSNAAESLDSNSSGSAGNRDIVTPLVLQLITLVFVI